MFQSVDNASAAPAVDRQAWIKLLSRAPLDLLEKIPSLCGDSTPQWLRKPEIGLMMVQGRAGATGERFNLGEVTVTRCVLKLTVSANKTVVGVSYVLGRAHRHAELAAMADALLQDDTTSLVVRETVLTPIQQALDIQREARRQRADSTKVEFFTIARESSSPEADEDEA